MFSKPLFQSAPMPSLPAPLTLWIGEKEAVADCYSKLTDDRAMWRYGDEFAALLLWGSNSPSLPLTQLIKEDTRALEDIFQSMSYPSVDKNYPQLVPCLYAIADEDLRKKFDSIRFPFQSKRRYL